MKLILGVITVFAFFVMISCNPAKKDSGQTDQVPVQSSTQEQQSAENANSIDTADVETTQDPASEENNEEVMLNPPHGEPFHRCDIPVGAPLNSSPATATMQNTTPKATTSQVTPTEAQAQTQTQPTTQRVASSSAGPTIENAQRLNSPQARSTSAPANPTGAKPRLNPAHGQPWHRCDIAVGSPLP